MQTYDDATKWDGDALSFGPEWGQGRSTFGGVAAAAALAKLRESVPAERTLRTAAVTFLGPIAPGAIRGEAAILREGRAMTFGEATLLQDGTPRLRLSGAFGAARKSSARVDAPRAPDRRPATDFEPFPYFPGVTPEFTQLIDFRWTDGAYPFSGVKEAAFAGYVRLRQPATNVEAAVLSLIDAWPCSILPTLKKPAPASSVTWTAHLLDLPESMPDDYWFFEQHVVSAADGYVTCVGRLYQPDGRLAAWSEQLVAVFD